MHYLKVKLYFHREKGFVKYHVLDGGYEPPKDPDGRFEYANVKYNGEYCRAFCIYVEDVGKPFEEYVERAQKLYKKWVAEGNTLFKTR